MNSDILYILSDALVCGFEDLSALVALSALLMQFQIEPSICVRAYYSLSSKLVKSCDRLRAVSARMVSWCLLQQSEWRPLVAESQVQSSS